MGSKNLADRLQNALGLEVAPVAITFTAEEPEARHVGEQQLSGCSYWSHAAAGNAFHTKAADHEGCVVGMHTHAVPMSEGKSQELQEQLGMMIGLEYLKEDEIPQIPHRTEEFHYAVYAPLGAASDVPDAVLVRGNARQMMMIAEAAHSAGLGYEGPTMGRPTCSIIPETMRTGRAVPSFGCAGNRVYTEISDGELWFGLPGSGLERIVERVEVLANANAKLDEFHKSRT